MRPFTNAEAREFIADWLYQDPKDCYRGRGEFRASCPGISDMDLLDQVENFAIERGIDLDPASYSLSFDVLEDPMFTVAALQIRSEPWEALG